MDIWDFILAYLISEYWGWIVLFIIICLAIAYPGFGVFLMVAIAAIGLIFFLVVQRDNIRAKQSLEAWESLSADEKREWNKVRIDKRNNDGGWNYYNGREAFYLVFKENYTLADCFRKQIKDFPEIPRKYYFPAGVIDIGQDQNCICFLGSSGHAYYTKAMNTIVENAKREGRRLGENDNLEREIRGVAWLLKQRGVDLDIIVKATELSREDVEGLLESDKTEMTDYDFPPLIPEIKDFPENLIYHYPNGVPELTEEAKAVVDSFKMMELEMAKTNRLYKVGDKIFGELKEMGVHPDIINEIIKEWKW